MTVNEKDCAESDWAATLGAPLTQSAEKGSCVILVLRSSPK